MTESCRRKVQSRPHLLESSKREVKSRPHLTDQQAQGQKPTRAGRTPAIPGLQDIEDCAVSNSVGYQFWRGDFRSVGLSSDDRGAAVYLSHALAPRAYL